MEAEEGKRVSISFICKLEDGTISDIALRDPLEFVIGQGNTLPSLETGVLGMKAGDCRTIKVSAAEVEEFPFSEDEAPTESHFPAGAERIPGLRYDFGPSEGGDDDVYMAIQEESSERLSNLTASSPDLFFEVEMISVEDDDLEMEELEELEEQ
ncbi:MAG: FKBP-type peptidyl-prolyl cis-trans isomerase [Desulfuromonadales bacterium]|nr:FKBP-type peptidyl-prolyl cis-trans isomerase [Desulfuromonadales bacterium]